MAFFLRWTLLYFFGAALLNLAFRDDKFFVGLRIFNASRDVAHLFGQGFVLVGIIFAAAWIQSPTNKDFLMRVLRAALVLVGCCLFLASFTAYKTALPYLAEVFGQRHFFADPFFAEFDRILHFGVDPWRVTHWLTSALGLTNFASHAAPVYGLIWAIPAFYLPAIMMLLGADRTTFLHYAKLYFFAWFIMGNVVALVGLSAGPVYYDALFATDRFADLHPALAAGGLENSWFGWIQPHLLEAYQSDSQAVGSGISAFPSLHVAMAMVVALYFSETSKYLRPLAWGFVGAITFISVWVGYHYLIDGYVSIAAVLLAHQALKRQRKKQEDRGAALNAIAAE